MPLRCKVGSSSEDICLIDTCTMTANGWLKGRARTFYCIGRIQASCCIHYAVSSEVHGIFEAVESDKIPARFQQMQASEKVVHDPLRGMAEVG